MEIDKQIKPEKIIADMSFFNKEKSNRFLMNEYKIVKDESGNAEVVIEVESLSDEEYEKIKHDKSKMIVEIDHQDSKLTEQLQVADLISGAMFCLYEYNDEEFVNILNSKGKVKISKNVVEKQ